MTSTYSVLLVNILIWAGIFVLLFRLDRRVSELEKSE